MLPFDIVIVADEDFLRLPLSLSYSVVGAAGHTLLLVYDHLVVVLSGGGVHYLHLKLHLAQLLDPDIKTLLSGSHWPALRVALD